MSDIANTLYLIKQRMAAVTAASGRHANDVTLLTVSKLRPEADIRMAIATGQRVFGENRVQEAKAKFSVLRSEYPDLKLHLIGPLQTNKADEAVKLFDVIETLDRPALAEALQKAVTKTGRAPQFYIEVNIGNEPQKAGIAPDDLEHFLKLCRDKHKLNINGLMCIPPQDKNPEPYFRQMKQFVERHKLKHLSMGMSSDFETAIKYGSTEVRIGRAVFGER